MMQINNIPKQNRILLNRIPKNLSTEDLEIVITLEKLKLDLDSVRNNLDQVTDPVLIDSYIYEINALNMRYKYYLELCKQKDIVADGYGEAQNC